jgi:hypothetical protein
MKKFSKKGVLLFAAAMALCAFMMPSVASAASWGGLGSHHVLDSPDVGFTSTSPLGAVSSKCTASTFTANVSSAANLEITATTFGGVCTATVGGAANICNTTATGQNLPWTGTAVTTSDIRLDRVHIRVVFDQSAVGGCPAALIGQGITITGTLGGGAWTGNGANQHEIVLLDDEGLSSHSALGNGTQVTARGTFRDTSQTLTVS